MKLLKRYSRSRILRAFRVLDRYLGMGLLFGERIEPQGGTPSERLKLFVLYGGPSRRRWGDLITRLNHYHLLKSLSERAELFLALSDGGMREIPSSEGIHFVQLPADRALSPLKSVPGGCSGVLILSPFNQYVPLFIRHSRASVLIWVESSELNGAWALNAVGAYLNILRESDRLITDAPWVPLHISSIWEGYKRWTVITPGRNFIRIDMDKDEAKKKISAALKRERFSKTPLIGWVPAGPPEKVWRAIVRIAERRREWSFVLFDPFFEFYNLIDLPNVALFGFQNAEDLDALSVALSALDVMFFPVVCGAQSFLLREAIEIGTKLVIAGPEGNFRAIDEIGGFVRWECNPFDPSDLPVEDVDGEIGRCLERGDEISSPDGRPEIYQGWDKVADRTLQLLKELNSTMLEPHRPPFQVLFARYYNKANNALETRAIQLPGFTGIKLEEGLALTLSEHHTDREITTLLKSLRREVSR